jgi:hypothetical protein
MTVKIIVNDEGNPAGKLADAELHFTDGPLAGLRLIGFSIWERRGGTGRTVTFRGAAVRRERRAPGASRSFGRSSTPRPRSRARPDSRGLCGVRRGGGDGERLTSALQRRSASAFRRFAFSCARPPPTAVAFERFEQSTVCSSGRCPIARANGPSGTCGRADSGLQLVSKHAPSRLFLQ